MSDKFNIYEEVEMPQGLKESIMVELKKEKERATTKKKYYGLVASMVIIIGIGTIFAYSLSFKDDKVAKGKLGKVAVNTTDKSVRTTVIEENTPKKIHADAKLKPNLEKTGASSHTDKIGYDSTDASKAKKDVKKETKGENKKETKVAINKNRIAYDSSNNKTKNSLNENKLSETKSSNTSGISQETNTNLAKSNDIKLGASEKTTTESISSNKSSNIKTTKDANKITQGKDSNNDNNKKNIIENADGALKNNQSTIKTTPDKGTDSELSMASAQNMVATFNKVETSKIQISFKGTLQDNDKLVKVIEKIGLQYEKNGNNINIKCDNDKYKELKEELKNIYGDNLVINEPEVINKNSVEVNIRNE